jgi:hypothetical protein
MYYLNQIKGLLIFGFLIFSGKQTYSQYNFASDSAFLPEYAFILEKLKISATDPNNLFECRIWISPSFDAPDLLRLVLNSDSNWIAEKYESRFKRNFIRRWIYRKAKLVTSKTLIRTDDSWTLTLDSLIQLGFLSLPDWKTLESNIVPQSHIENGKEITYARMAICDGTNYTIELLTMKSKRRYSYHCPKAYSNFYNQSAELKSIVKILEILFRKYQYHDDICIVDRYRVGFEVNKLTLKG